MSLPHPARQHAPQPCPAGGICLDAERLCGELAFERAPLARGRGNSCSALGRHLAELAAERVCEIASTPNQYRASRLCVLPVFGPYQAASRRSAATAPAAPDGGCAAYVECVQGPFTSANERLAEAWHRAGTRTLEPLSPAPIR